MKRASKTFVLTLGLAALAACSKTAVYTTESFASDSPFELKVVDGADTACESARRALLRQGYLIEKATGENVKGRKGYKAEDNRNTFIEMNVVCAADISGSTVFANGVLSTYDLKKSSSAASVGVSAVGTISLPIGQSADSLVKVSEETINDKDFYNRFFAAVDRILGDMRAAARAAAPVPEPEPEPIPEPGPVRAVAAPEAAPAVAEPAPVPQAPATAPPQPAPVPVDAAGQALPVVTPQPAPSPGVPTVAEPVPAPAAPATVPEPGTPSASAPGPAPAIGVSAGAPEPGASPAEKPAFGPVAPPPGEPTLPASPEPAAPVLQPDDGLEPIPLPGADAPLP